MVKLCKWCKGTGLYYPLTGPADPCRECVNGIEFHTQTFNIEDIRKPSIRLGRLNMITIKKSPEHA